MFCPETTSRWVVPVRRRLSSNAAGIVRCRPSSMPAASDASGSGRASSMLPSAQRRIPRSASTIAGSALRSSSVQRCGYAATAWMPRLRRNAA